MGRNSTDHVAVELNHEATRDTTTSFAQQYASDYPQSIRVFSYNCWGLKFLATYRYERLLEIGKQIAALDPKPDIVGLQECWTQQDYLAIRELTNHFLPYGKFYHSGIFGGGLAILSRWPIEESNMVRYPLNGRPTAFFRGDWYVGKGVACAKVRIGPGKRDVAEVFTTHLHAPYETEPNDSYLCHRTAQAWEIAKLMRGAAERGHLVIGLGDFNMVPLSLAHRLIESQAPVRDIWRVAFPHSSLGAADSPVEAARSVPMPSVQHNLTDNGATCDGPANTWRWPKDEQKRLAKGEDQVVDMLAEDPKGRRLDYVFFGAGEGNEDGSDSRRWHVEDVRVGMTARHPTLRCSLSDHFSVEATLSWQWQSGLHEQSDKHNTTTNGFTTHSQTRSTTSNTQPLTISPITTPLPASLSSEILAMIATYTLRERRQRRLRLGHFVGSVVFSIGCFVGVWFAPAPWLCFLLLVLSTLGFAAGVIDGLIGGLFMSSEIRALKEFKWEIENAAAAAMRVRKVEDGL